MRKTKRDSSKMGRWAREAKHRDALSLRNSLRRPKFKRTAIEIKMFDVLTFLGYDVTQEFLIQTKDHRGDGKLFYRHVYDLYVESLNLLDSQQKALLLYAVGMNATKSIALRFNISFDSLTRCVSSRRTEITI